MNLTSLPVTVLNGQQMWLCAGELDESRNTSLSPESAGVARDRSIGLVVPLCVVIIIIVIITIIAVVVR